MRALESQQKVLQKDVIKTREFTEQRSEEIESKYSKRIEDLEHQLTETSSLLAQIQQENKEREERLISLIVKESLVGKPVIPKKNLDLIFSGDLNAIPLSVSNREGNDVKDFIINKDIESIKNNYEEESKKIKPKLASKGKSKLYVLEDPPEGFRTGKKK